MKRTLVNAHVLSINGDGTGLNKLQRRGTCLWMPYFVVCHLLAFVADRNECNYDCIIPVKWDNWCFIVER